MIPAKPAKTSLVKSLVSRKVLRIGTLSASWDVHKRCGRGERGTTNRVHIREYRDEHQRDSVNDEDDAEGHVASDRVR